MSVRIVVSIEAGTPTEWQAALLCYSLRRAGETAPITVLCAGGPPREPMLDATVVVHQNYRGFDGGNYAPFNQCCGIRDWLELCPGPDDAVVLVLDPDMVAFGPLPGIPPTLPRADIYPVDRTTLHESTVRNLTRHPELLQPIGLPLWIREGMLRAAVPGWIEQTVRVRRFGSSHVAWTPLLVGYQLAAADLGITHDAVIDSCGPGLFHYYTGHCGIWFWKGRYRPWDPPPALNSNEPTAVAFRELLGEYAGLRRGVASPP